MLAGAGAARAFVQRSRVFPGTGALEPRAAEGELAVLDQRRAEPVEGLAVVGVALEGLLQVEELLDPVAGFPVARGRRHVLAGAGIG